MRKKIYVEKANPGNLMFRLMFAEHLRRQIPGSIITGASMPEWGILLHDDMPSSGIKIGGVQRVDVPKLVQDLTTSNLEGVVVGCYAQRLEYFQSNRDHFTVLFRSLSGGQVIYPDELAIHVRAGEILQGVHEGYPIVPIAYYRRLIESTGLRPVFMGQTRPSFYVDALRKSFPEARFIAGNHWLDDFQTARNAENIVISVSTFTWLAAWLSETAKRIYMPELGLFNPLQFHDVDLSPRNDPRFVFERFPIHRFRATPEQIAAALHDPGRSAEL